MRRMFQLPALAAWLAASLLSFTPAAAQDLKFFVPLALTGPLAFTGQAQQAGWQHAVDYINKNGGIKGRKIDISFLDDEYKVDLSVAGFKKAAANGDLVFAAANGTGAVRAVTPENNERYKVLMSNLGASSDMIEVDKYPYHFLVGPTYSDMIGMLYTYMKKRQGSGPAPKVALVYSATEFGRDPLEFARKQAAAMGINIVLEEETRFVGVDVTGHAIKIRRADPDYVIFHGYAGNIWPEIAKQLRDYGVKAKFMGTMFNSTPDLINSIGPSVDGFVGAVSLNLVTKDHTGPMMKVVDDYLKTWTTRPYTGFANVAYVNAWATALLLREAIGNAIAAGKPLTGDNLIKEVTALKNWDSGGLFGGPISFEKNRIPFGVINEYSFNGKDMSVKAAEWLKVE